MKLLDLLYEILLAYLDPRVLGLYQIKKNYPYLCFLNNGQKIEKTKNAKLQIPIFPP